MASPAMENLNKAIVSARQAADNLNAMITDARPGVQNFSKSTLPEANKLVHDLRDLSNRSSRCPIASISRASAARSGRRSCPTTSQGNANEAALEDRGLGCRRRGAGGCSLGGLLGGGSSRR